MNGEKILEPQFKVNLDMDVIELDGKVVEGVESAGQHFYFLVNKPKGYVCSTKSGGGGSRDNKGKNEETGNGGKKALDLLQSWTDQWKKGNPGKLPPRLFRGWSIGRSNDWDVVGDDRREMVAKSRAPIVWRCEEVRDYGAGKSD